MGQSAERRQYLTFKEAAEEFGISVTSLRRATRDAANPLPYYVPNGQKRGWRLRRADLEAWLRGCRRVAGAAS